MNIMPYIIIGAVVCIVALVSTIFIGMNPNDENYKKSTKQRWTLLSIIYIVTFVPALIFTIVYFVIR